jgi:hypothetical protein
VPDLSPVTTFTFGKHQEQLHRITFSSRDGLKLFGEGLVESTRCNLLAELAKGQLSETHEPS